MNIRQPVSQHWQKLSITVKFGVAFGLLLGLIVLVALTGYAALTFVQSQSDSAILVSAEIRGLVLQMDGGLERARRLQRDFFLQYPAVGLTEAHQSAQLADEQIAQVITYSDELKRLISTTDVSDAWRASDVNLNFYFSAAERYQEVLEEAVGLVDAEVNLQARLDEEAALLQDALRETTLQARDEHSVALNLYYEMRLLEKDYWATRQRSWMQSAFNVALRLQQAMQGQASFSSAQKAQALIYLDDYQATAQEILDLNSKIRSKLHEFDLQAEEVDPISAELVHLANDEVGRARDKIDQASGLAIIVLLLATASGLALAGLIARMLHWSITHNVIKLTQAAGELQAGNLAVQAQVNSADELGVLAAAFNAMAAETQARVKEMTRLNQTLQASEQMFRKLFEDSRDTIVLTALDGQVVDANKAGERLTGYPRAELMKRNVLEFYTNPQERHKFVQAMEQNGAVDNFQVQIRRRDGTLREVLLNSTTRRAQDGALLGFHTRVHDITERVQAEQALARQAQELARFNAELERFTYVTAHHLQEPLFTVVNFSQLLARHYGDQLDAEAGKFIDFIVNSAIRMKRLLQDLLSYLELDKRETRFEAMPGETVWQRALMRLQQIIAAKDAVITHDALPVVVGDIWQLEQVFEQLLDNALKFHGDAPPQIHVSASSCETDKGREWRFAVRDNGIGIEPEYAERIFQVFERLHTWDVYPGTGIGLATCKKIIERHGGRIWVESQLDQGATFYFTIPAREPANV